MIHNLVHIFIGFAGGLAVGGGFVAFLTVLDIIPRLSRIFKITNVRFFENAVIFGTMYWTLADQFTFDFHLTWVIPALLGLLAGMFVGMLAGALTEVLNVIPILSKRLGLQDYILWLLMAMIFGKVAGSILHWTLF
jgi:stage V sporulation protein AB